MGDEASQYYVISKIDDGAFEELQSLSIAENQFIDKPGREIMSSSGQTQLMYKVATVNDEAGGDVIHLSIEVSAF